MIDGGPKGEHDPCDEMNGRGSLVFTHRKEQQRIISRGHA
jgi:hypothetical protein